LWPIGWCAVPVNGRRPKQDGQAVTRHRLAGNDWREYPNEPFAGAPPLPPRGRGKWSQRTLGWWAAVSTMPHCVDWTAADWQYAFDTMLIVAAFHGGDLKYDSAMRAREKVIGTTADYRAALRIRYYTPTAPRGLDDDDDDYAADDGGRPLSIDEYKRIMEL
jgi:hypothetical protein